MEDKQSHVQALQDIRQMMRQSSRFLSLSGLSGVFAGIFAMGGAFIADREIDAYLRRSMGHASWHEYSHLVMKCAFIGCGVLLLSLLSAIFFSSRKAARRGERLFDHTTLRLMVNLGLPLVTGGIFCLALIFKGQSYAGLLAPSMLVFYGLSLVNGSRYTLHDIRYLGCMEIALGLSAAFLPVFGLIFWTIGFGGLHILYGTMMWFKYDRKTD